MSLAKFVSNSVFREHVQRSFILHRDLKSCLSLIQAQKLVNERQNQIKQYGKTAFLQFLNNFPLNYSYKMLNSPLRIFLFSLQLKDLSIYQQQLRYTIFSKLRGYICNEQKSFIQQQINKSQKALIEIIKEKPFDVTHSINFLLLQKQNKNNELFFHCLDVIKNTQYRLLQTVMSRILPILLKRLNLEQWNIIRKFEYIIDHLSFNFIPKDIFNLHYIHLLQKITSLQLHTVAYQKIPPAIDFIIGYFAKELETDRRIDMSKLLSIFKVFDYLPMGYNQKFFKALLNKILQKGQNQEIYLSCVPFKRLSQTQIFNLFQKCSKTIFNFDLMIFSGNHSLGRKYYLKTDLPKKLYSQFSNIHLLNQKIFFNSLISVAILIQYYKKDEKTIQKLKQQTKKLFERCSSQLGFQNISRFYSVSNIFNLITIQNTFQLGHKKMIDKMSLQILYRAENEGYKEIRFLDNLQEAILLYANSPIPQIRTIISGLLINYTKRDKKFYFSKYSSIIFTLLKSQYSKQYMDAIKKLLSLMLPGECQYLIELYNRFHSKSIKFHIEFINLAKSIDSSFTSMGKFMVTSSYSHFTSSKGELILDYRNIIEKIQPLLNINSLKGYFLPQTTSIIRFCNHFYYYMSSFTRKFIMLSLQYVQNVDFKKDGGKMVISYLHEVTMLQAVSDSGQQVNKRILKLIKKVRQIYPQLLIFKVKQIQMGWLLGQSYSQDIKSLLVQQILSQLSNSNYSEKHADTMMLLLKLNSLNQIKLKDIVEKKLSDLIISGIENNIIKTNQIINQINFPFKKGGSTIDNKNTHYLAKILLLCLDKMPQKHNFDYYMNIVQLAHYLRNVELVARTFDCLSKPLLNAPQIKKIINLLKFYRNISADHLAQKLLVESVNYLDYLQEQCCEIMFSVNSMKNQLTQKQMQLNQILLKKHQQILNNSMKKIQKQANSVQQRHFLAALIKHLWVCLKINKIDMTMKPFFKIAIQNFKNVKSFTDNGNFEGIPSENIALIYSSFISFIQKNDPKWFQEFKVSQKTSSSLFKAKKSVSNQITHILQENKKTYQFLLKYQKTAQINRMAQKLIELGFIKEAEGSKNEGNVFVMNKMVNGVILKAWLRKDNIDYGIINLDQRFLNIAKKPKGRLNFTVNCLRIITGTKIIVFQQGKNIKFQ